MEKAATNNVPDLLAGDKQQLAAILGAPLGGEQSVFALAYTPLACPSDEARRNAARAVADISARSQANIEIANVASEDAHSAIDEASEYDSSTSQ